MQRYNFFLFRKNLLLGNTPLHQTPNKPYKLLNIPLHAGLL